MVAEFPKRRLLSFAIAVYQNAGSLPGLVDEILDMQRAELAHWDCEIVFVDDGSTDGSREVLEQLAGDNPSITVIRLSRNFGQLFAMIAAIDHARGDVVISVSADQQDPIAVSALMVRAFEGGSDVVVAYREDREDAVSTRLSSRLAYSFLRLSTPMLPKGGFDYFLLSRRAADIIRSQNNRNRFFQTDVLSLGFGTAFIPYTRRARRHGKSQYTFLKRLHSLSNAIVDSSYLPIRLMSLAGLAFTVFGILYAMLVVVGRFMNRVPYDGWAVIVILILMVGGLTIMTLGILGEYIWRIYDELRSKPLYIVEAVNGERQSGSSAGRDSRPAALPEHEVPRGEEKNRHKARQQR